MSAMRLAALLKGTSLDWSDDLIDDATRHGVLPLIAWKLRRSGVPLSESLERDARFEAAHDAIRQQELEALLAQFASAGVALLVIKGGALARTLYPHSSLRPRCDTDLLIDRELVPAAEDVLRNAGYAMEADSCGEIIRRQRSWTRVSSLGMRHSIDLHWALSNRQRYANVLPAAEVYARGVPTVGSVQVPCAADALLIAAVHLIGHHSAEHRLIWLYDIHLLHAAMSADELEAVAARARNGRMALALDAALALAVRWLGDGRHTPDPASRDQLGDVIDDLRCAEGVRMRLRMIAEHLFPPAAYMMAKYAAKRRGALPALYVRRAFAGSARLLRSRLTAKS